MVLLSIRVVLVEENEPLDHGCFNSTFQICLETQDTSDFLYNITEKNPDFYTRSTGARTSLEMWLMCTLYKSDDIVYKKVYKNALKKSVQKVHVNKKCTKISWNPYISERVCFNN